MLALLALSVGFSLQPRMLPSTRVTVCTRITVCTCMQEGGYIPPSEQVDNRSLLTKLAAESAVSALPTYMFEMQDAFNAVDTDGDGLIGASDLLKLMSEGGDEVTEDQVADMLAKVDVRNRDARGEPLIFFEQWAKLMNDQAGDLRGRPAFKWPWL